MVLFTILCLTRNALTQEEKRIGNSIINSPFKGSTTKNSITTTEGHFSTTTSDYGVINQLIHPDLQKNLLLIFMVLGFVVVMSLVIPLVSIVKHKCKPSSQFPYATMV